MEALEVLYQGARQEGLVELTGAGVDTLFVLLQVIARYTSIAQVDEFFRLLIGPLSQPDGGLSERDVLLLSKVASEKRNELTTRPGGLRAVPGWFPVKPGSGQGRSQAASGERAPDRWARKGRDGLRGAEQSEPGLVFLAPVGRCPMSVRRDSHMRGRSEGLIWRPMTRKDVQAILKAAEIYNEAGLRQKGERSGPLGSVALDVLRLFVNLIDFRTGRLEPSIATIMDRLGRSRDTIVRALKNLRAHGFIDWLRRYERTGNDGRGPQVQQTSNAYRLSLPEKARQFLGRLGKAPPLPDDHSAAQEARAAELDAYRKALPLDEMALSEVGDTPLGQALATLGRMVQKRESDKQTESLTHLIFHAEAPAFRPGRKRSSLLGLWAGLDEASQVPDTVTRDELCLLNGRR